MPERTNMTIHVVTYDLRKSGQNYHGIIERIKAYGIWCHVQGSVWLIKSSQTCEQIRNNLDQALDANDSIFVAKLSGEAAWRGLNLKQSNWLKEVA
jgi:CRISPR/Cas system-associated endoribonuclease Cas2